MERRVPLVGRDREMRLMTTVLDAARAGRPSVVVVDGPDGSGRTRMLAELAAVGRGRGVRVLLDPGATAGVAPGDPVVVAYAVRSGPVPAGACRIPLAPLPDDDMARLAGLLLSARPGPEILDLSRAAAGRPGALRHLIAGWREDDLLRVAAGTVRLRVTRLPARARDAILDRVATMSPGARQLVQAATTLRAPFPLVALARLLGVGPLALLPGFEEALGSGLLVSDGDRVRFSHEAVRPIVASSMPRPVAAALRDRQPPPGRRAAGGTAVTVRPMPAPKQAEPAPLTDREQTVRPIPAPLNDREQEAAEPAPLTDREQTVRPMPAPEPAEPAPLTDREQEVALLVGRAMTNQQIAGRLGCSPHTVNFHLRQIFRKLGLSSRVELASRLPPETTPDHRALPVARL